jgi:MmgE/PrpD C-terminal domain
MAHSPAYFAAAAARDRRFSWEHASPEKISDPGIHALIDKVRVGPPPTENAAEYRQGATVCIEMTDGHGADAERRSPPGRRLAGHRDEIPRADAARTDCGAQSRKQPRGDPKPANGSRCRAAGRTVAMKEAECPQAQITFPNLLRSKHHPLASAVCGSDPVQMELLSARTTLAGGLAPTGNRAFTRRNAELVVNSNGPGDVKSPGAADCRFNKCQRSWLVPLCKNRSHPLGQWLQRCSQISSRQPVTCFSPWSARRLPA